jgi:hypothetical protein
VRQPEVVLLDREWQGEHSVLIHHGTPPGVQHSVARSPRLPLEAPSAMVPWLKLIPPANGFLDRDEPPRVSSDTGPLLLPPRGVLK